MFYLIFSVALFCFAIYEIATLFKKLPLLQALPYCIILFIGVQCILFGALSFFAVGFNGYINVVLECLVAALCLIIKRIHSRNAEQGRHENALENSTTLNRLGSKADIAAIVFNLLFIAVLSLLHFGPEFSLAFLSSDSAAHYSSIITYADGATTKGQFSFGISGACVLDAIHFAIEPDQYYKVYVFTELFWWWLSTQMFYTLLRRIATQLNAPTIMLLCALYTFGYPFYSVNLGFGYYGASIAVTCAVFFTITCLPLNNALNLSSLSILLAELAVSYLLFIPPVYLIAFVAVFLADSNWRSQIRKRIILSITIMLIPCIFAVFLSYTGFFFGGTTSTISQSIDSFSTGLARDANTLKVLYADFIFIAPLAIYGFVAKVAKRGAFLPIGLFSSIFTLYCAALFVLCIFKVVSPYYYYKTYAILWMIFFICTAIGIEQLLQTSKKLVLSYGCVWLMIIALAVTGLDAKLSEKRPNLDTASISNQIFPLYTFNSDTSRPPIFDPATLSQIREHENSSLPEDQIALLTGQNEHRWIQSIGFDGKCIQWQTNHNGTTYETHDAETLIEAMNDFDYIYIDDTFYGRPDPTIDFSALDEVSKYIIANSDVLFETDFGTMYRMHRDAA